MMTAAPDHGQTTDTKSRVVTRLESTDQTEVEAFIFEMLGRLDAAEFKAEHLGIALLHSRDIGAAIGILMCQHKIQQPQAFELLRHSSQDRNRKLHDVAMDVLNTGELPRAGR